MSFAETDRAYLGILVGGGPAPGINGVISAVTIEAEHHGVPVVGFYDGFEKLSLKDEPERIELVSRRRFVSDARREVSRIDWEGGSILRTSRYNPTDEEINRIICTLKRLNVSYLVTIGGDDTALSASRLCKGAEGKVRVAHVPKTIDNDLPLPGDMPTFGFRTACELGAKLVRNLMVDAATMARWFFVVTMGRKAGHLALGIGKGAGATITVIPEDPEFGEIEEKVSADCVCDVLEAAIYKRLAMGRKDGVAVIAEGVALKLEREELERLTGRKFKCDEAGHVRLGDFDMAPVWKEQLQKRLEERNVKVNITAQNIGYPLRCEPPNVFDREFVRELGYSAVLFLMEEHPDQRCKQLNGAMVYVEHGVPKLIEFDKMLKVDAETGKVKVDVRFVDVKTDSYKVARKYMIRLERSDLEDTHQLNLLACAANMTPEEFRQRFGYLVQRCAA